MPNHSGCFDPRPRTEGDAPAGGTKSCPFLFRSTPPHGGRHAAARIGLPRKMFRSTPPHGGRPPFEAVTFTFEVFRSTPPHGGRRLRPAGCSQVPRVSIHAPARRATRHVGAIPSRHPVSIHAPARRATCCWGSSRPRRVVSIHAPARRATTEADRELTAHEFRSTPPHGGRLSATRQTRPRMTFRSTPPHGGRQLGGG